MLKTFRQLVEEAKQVIQTITPEELCQRVQEEGSWVVIDVREPEDYKGGHLPGAVNIPRGVLEMKIDEVATSEETPIVVYCGGGSRAALSAKALQEMGYRRVFSLEGGFRGWRGGGYPVEEGE
jgi:rhodanese-related sulfurtransferase